MNGMLVKNLDSKSSKKLKTSLKNVRGFVSNKRKSRKGIPEIKPLISNDNDSESDEEITLHDIRDLSQNAEVDDQRSCLRNIKKSDTVNGTTNVSKTSDPFQHCDFLYLNVEKGDTLQSISIKYQCAVSDIKRANNLMSSQEFYGLKHVRIPVKKYSLLSEILPSSIETKRNSMIVEVHDSSVRTINIGIGGVGRCPSPQDSAAFFQRMDEDLVKIMLSTNSQKESLEAAAVALTSPQIQPLVKDPYNTVDCGIQWNYLLVCVIIFAVVIPAITLYFYMRSSHESHHDVISNASSTEPTVKNPS